MAPDSTTDSPAAGAAPAAPSPHDAPSAGKAERRAPMQPLDVTPEHNVPAAALAASFTRDLGEGGGPAEARATPTAVELRLDLRLWEGLSDRDKACILAFVPLKADRRGTVRVVFGEGRSRRQNLAGARGQLREFLQRALAGETGVPEPEVRRKRGGARLVKRDRGTP